MDDPPRVPQPKNDCHAKKDNSDDSCLSYPPPPAAFLYPSVVIEVTSDGYKLGTAVIKEQGPLHWKRVPTLLKCIEVENGECGAYLAFRLGKRLHY